MDKSKSPAIHLVAIALGISLLTGTIFHRLSFRVFDPTPVWISRAFIILVGTILTMILVWMVHRELRQEPSLFHVPVFLIGMPGSIVALIGSSFDLLNAIAGHALIIWFPLSQTQSIIAVGYGFIGIWLLLLNFHSRLLGLWSTGLTWLGMISGLLMAMGLFAIPRVFIPYVSLYHQLVPELGEVVGNWGWMIIYPIWSIWFGSLEVMDRHGDRELHNFV